MLNLFLCTISLLFSFGSYSQIINIRSVSYDAYAPHSGNRTDSARRYIQKYCKNTPLCRFYTHWEGRIDPAPGVRKVLEVKFSCNDEVRVKKVFRSNHNDHFDNSILIDCQAEEGEREGYTFAPRSVSFIEIISATYGGNNYRVFKETFDNVKNILIDKCTGQTIFGDSLSLLSPSDCITSIERSDIKDPTYGFEKDLSVIYRDIRGRYREFFVGADDSGYTWGREIFLNFNDQ